MIDALGALTLFIKRKLTSRESEYVQKIADRFPEEGDQRSFALRLIVHYVGDIHQPLHNISKVDFRHSKGDRGGNMQLVPDDGRGVKNLHMLWDSVIYKHYTKQVLPLS